MRGVHSLEPIKKKKRSAFWRFFVVVIALYILWIFIAAWPFLNFAFHPFKLLWGQKQYLVLFQNNYELRPTGGFISAFGILTVKNGIPISFNFEDVYGTVDDHPFVPPPEPIGELLEHPTYQGHTFRDANFNPNFPDSVSQIEEFLRLTRPSQQLDGVFALDMSFMENWLRVTGPVNVNGREFSADNFFETLEEAVSNVDLHDLKMLGQRKMIVKSLAKKLAVKTALPWNFPGFIKSVRQSLDQKHALLYFKDDELQRLPERKNWAGVMKSDLGQDFLAIIDANYGGAKSNRYVSRNIFYYVDLVEGRSYLDVRMDQPNGYFIPFSADYRGYLRAYVPKDHRLVDSFVFDKERKANSMRYPATRYEGREGDFNFAGLTHSVVPRSSEMAHFEFQFPKSVFDAPSYRINLWKQPGAPGDYLQVTVRVPAGMHLKSRDFEVKENVAIFRGFLDRDRALIFELEKDSASPRAILQNLDELNSFEIEWNEPVDPKSADFFKWKIEDSNYGDSQADAISIISVEINGTRMFVKTDGMTAQPEESYKFEISGISDFSGNKIEKRTYTFFQRLK